MRKFLIALLALPIGCALPPKAPPPAAPKVAVTEPAGPYERYAVAASHVEIRVYRDGAMAQLGHNHLISSDALRGSIRLRNPVSDSRFTLELPLDSLVVDDPALRSKAGPDFAKDVPQSDRDGTRRNMLGASMLDAARQPVLRLSVDSLEGGPTEFQARMRVGLRGEERVISVPMTLKSGEGKLSAHASVKLHHADLGLTPFTAALGALRVRDEFEIDCRLDAKRDGSTP
ncbi:MAG: YceI family protein [Steroidobacteraceae bacterium]